MFPAICMRSMLSAARRSSFALYPLNPGTNACIFDMMPRSSTTFSLRSAMFYPRRLREPCSRARCPFIANSVTTGFKLIYLFVWRHRRPVLATRPLEPRAKRAIFMAYYPETYIYNE